MAHAFHLNSRLRQTATVRPSPRQAPTAVAPPSDAGRDRPRRIPSALPCYQFSHALASSATPRARQEAASTRAAGQAHHRSGRCICLGTGCGLQLMVNTWERGHYLASGRIGPLIPETCDRERLPVRAPEARPHAPAAASHGPSTVHQSPPPGRCTTARVHTAPQEPARPRAPFLRIPPGVVRTHRPPGSVCWSA